MSGTFDMKEITQQKTQCNSKFPLINTFQTQTFVDEAGICRCSEGACVGSGGVVVWQERNIHTIHPFAISQRINIYASHTTSKEV